MGRSKPKKNVELSDLAPKPYTGILNTPIWLQEITPPVGASSDSSEEHVRAPFLRFRSERAKLYLEARIALYHHYGIDVSQPDAEMLLLEALIRSHVPAFHMHAALDKLGSFRSSERGQATRLDATGTIIFVVDVEEAKAQLEGARNRVSDRAIAKRLAAMDRYRKLGLNAETLRKLLADLKTADRDFKTGRATEFQKNFLFRVIPLVEDASTH